MSAKPATAVASASPFTRYEVFVIAILAFLQFTVILDFMILSPLGAMLLDQLGVTTGQFGLVVSGYAIAAGASGLLAAGFADRFDRKRLLLFFYAGFIVGTLLCALAPTYPFLLVARIFTGFFGGVIGSVSMAIVADVFPLERRGRVMGFVQSAFAAAQVLGLPLGLWLANHFGWHAGFMMIVVVSTLVGLVIVFRLKPIDAHLAVAHKRHPLRHLWLTAVNARYITGFAATILLTTGGFMLMPFGSTFSVHNLGLRLDQLPMIYMITGLSSLIVGPLLGRLSDTVGRYRIFVIGTIVGVGIVLFYTRLGPTSIGEIILLNVVLFSSISARMVSAGALTSAMPALADRGAYMSISSSVQQFSGGVASWVAGLVVVQSSTGKLLHYETLGYLVSGSMAASAVLLYQVHRLTAEKKTAAPPTPEFVQEVG
jgi:predicted MFS family arabinose efflux permease